MLRALLPFWFCFCAFDTQGALHIFGFPKEKQSRINVTRKLGELVESLKLQATFQFNPLKKVGKKNKNSKHSSRANLSKYIGVTGSGLM